MSTSLTIGGHRVLGGDGVQQIAPLVQTGIGSDDPVRYVIKNGWCCVYLRGVGSSSAALNAWYIVAGPLPKPATGCMLYTASLNQARLNIGTDGKYYVDIYKSNSNLVYGSLVYPIANDWYPGN